MVGQHQKAVLIHFANVSQPFGRYTVAQQLVIRAPAEQQYLWIVQWLGCRFVTFRRRSLLAGGNNDFFVAFSNFDPLRRPCRGMHFQFSTLGPFVGLIVVIDIAEQETGGRLVHDQANVAADPD